MTTDFAPIAVVAASARVPGGDDVTDLNHLLRRPAPPTRVIPATRWPRDVDEHAQALPRRGRFLTDPFSFDCAVFDLSPEQAVRLDPQQRMMLETGRQALDGAGLLRTRGASVGVFVGARMNGYGHDAAAAQADPSREIAAAALWGRSQNFIAAWLADRFDLTGPALVVDTACSSSLTAVWLACQALHTGQCDAALVGGVDLLVDPLTFTLLGQAGALARDGRCKTFDPAADGYGPGEGAGAVVLKPREAAVRNGDPVLGCIVAARSNNDGATMGVTTPNVNAQVQLLREVYRDLDATRLRYVETHGTGTTIGDPIETQALATVLAEHGVPAGSVALGAAKRSIGHLHSAAGVVSLISALLALEHGPPPLDLDGVNPRLRLDDTPLYVSTGHAGPGTGRGRDGGRLVGVSAFGFGGTNVHVAMQAEPTIEEAPAPAGDIELLTISAPTGYQLADLAAQWVGLLHRSDPAAVRGLCAAARARPAALRHRLAVVAKPAAMAAELQRNLLSLGTDEEAPGREPAPLGVAAGADVRWVEALARAEPAVARVVDEFGQATGLRPSEYPQPLARLATMAAAVTALAAVGVPADAVALPPGWEGLARLGWEAGPLEETLPELTGAATSAETDPPRGSILTRLRTTGGAGLREELLRIAADAYRRGFDLMPAGRTDPPPAATPIPQFAYTGAPLSLNEATRSPRPGSATQVTSDVDGLTFERTYSPGEHVIAQHEVNQRPMMPGVGWIQLIGEGVTAAGETFHGVSDMVFARPLMPDRPTRVTCRVTQDDSFTITDRSGLLYVTGRLLRSAASPGTAPDLTGLLRQARSLTSGTELYRWLRRLGYYHGRYFRNIAWLAASGAHTLAHVTGARQRTIDPVGARWSPGLLDSVTIAGVDPGGDMFGHDDAPMFVPLSAAKVTVHGDLADAAYVVTESLHRSRETCRLTQHILDARGTPLLTLHEVSSKRVPAGSFTEQDPGSDDTGPTRSPDRAVSATTTTPVPDEAADPVTAAVEPRPRPAAPADPLLAWVLRQAGADDADTEFLDLGLDSVALVELSSRIEEVLGIQLYPTVLFEHPTPAAFTSYLRTLGATPPEDRGSHATTAEREPVRTPQQDDEAVVLAAVDGDLPTVITQAAAPAVPDRAGTPSAQAREVAVIGMAVNVPHADTLAAYWDLVTAGESTVGPPPPARATERPELQGQASYLERVDLFDPAPFRVAPREAPHLDPQARIVYETIWRALEDAGWAGTDNVGLWVGYSHDHYYEQRVRSGVRSGRGLGLEAMIANRLSYIMDWNGPSAVVNTLCSSGLVGLHQAIRSLREGECELAVVAGVHAGIGPEYMHSMGELMAHSPSGACRAFDAAADGFAPGEGAVAVVLQAVPAATAHQRRIHAVLKGSAVTHNGRTTRYSAPSPSGQSRTITAALADAEVDPSSIGLLEAHGTGTSLGDPIEVQGLTSAWDTAQTQFCALGSVKSVIGHLEPAAGLAGLVKAILAMQERTIPPTLHIDRPNDHLRLERTPFYISDRPRPWTSSTPRRAAVSAFGMGGVNAHVIVEEPPRQAAGTAGRAGGPYIVRVSGATDTAVRSLAGAYRRHLEREGEPGTAEVLCATATRGRASMRRRAVVTAPTVEQLERGLGAVADGATPATGRPVSAPELVFMLGGQGSQYPGMAAGLASLEPAVADVVARMDEILTAQAAPPLSRIWTMDQAQLTRTENAQPAIVGSHVAIVTLLASWGVRPTAVVGHSVGELSAAWAAGCLDLESLFTLVTARARAMQAQPASGTMAAVHATPQQVREALLAHPGVEVAAYNGPRTLTVAAERDDLARFRETSGLPCQILDVSHAFHSRAMRGATAPVAAATARLVAAGAVREPRIRFASTATGGWHTADTVRDPDVWAGAVTGPVRLHEALSAVSAAAAAVYVEVGAHPVLTPLARTVVADGTWIPTLHRDGAEDPPAQLHQMHGALGTLSEHVEPDWQAVVPARPVGDIPTYPFERNSYWLTEGAS